MATPSIAVRPGALISEGTRAWSIAPITGRRTVDQRGCSGYSPPTTVCTDAAIAGSRAANIVPTRAPADTP